MAEYNDDWFDEAQRRAAEGIEEEFAEEFVDEDELPPPRDGCVFLLVGLLVLVFVANLLLGRGFGWAVSSAGYAALVLGPMYLLYRFLRRRLSPSNAAGMTLVICAVLTGLAWLGLWFFTRS